ncbi:MAG TPA: hypothetical protein VFR23_19490 [Jiangellaceae bacterium]|nr:hypothetical protein [Jiangellaceae bacterium]
MTTHGKHRRSFWLGFGPVAVALILFALTLVLAPTANAARPLPDPASYTEMAQFYKCGDYRHGPAVRGWLVRTRWGYAHVTVEPYSPVAECKR